MTEETAPESTEAEIPEVPTSNFQYQVPAETLVQIYEREIAELNTINLRLRSEKQFLEYVAEALTLQIQSMTEGEGHSHVDHEH